MEILLTDMDGVLLDSRAYHVSLQHTLDRIAVALGFAPNILSYEHILAFEVAGVTAEWDSASMCAALLLERLWQVRPEARLDASRLAEPYEPHSLLPPDLAGFANKLGRDRSTETRPLENAAGLLRAMSDGRPTENTAVLVDIVLSARIPERSLTYRLIQEQNLGSQRYAQFYQIPPVLATESYLETLDRPALSPQEQRCLLKWAARPESAVAIFTNRPSLSPDGSGGLPEAEIGRALAGLEALPMMSMGGLGWLARRRGLEEQSYLKPSPVHVLAALQLALGAPQVEALEAAALLALDGIALGSWRGLEAVRVFAVEDASKGLRSAAGALAALRNMEIYPQLHLIGISTHPDKARALEQSGARVFPHLRDFLPQLSGWEGVAEA